MRGFAGCLSTARKRRVITACLPRFPLSCAAAQYFRSAAHCISIDNRTTNYALSISRADLFLELTWPSIPRTLSMLLEGTLMSAVTQPCNSIDSLHITACDFERTPWQYFYKFTIPSFRNLFRRTFEVVLGANRRFYRFNFYYLDFGRWKVVARPRWNGNLRNEESYLL